MLPNVDYLKLEDLSFSLTDLEYDTLESCTDFLEELKVVLLYEKFRPVPEFLIAHLCAYLGAVITVHTVLDAEKLKEQTITLVQQQAKVAYQHFSEYPINSTVKTQEEQVNNLNRLRQATPGSIVNQTMRLEQVIIEILEELKGNCAGTVMPLNEQDPQILCSQEMLAKLVLYLSGKRCVLWREQLN